jgi:hypothetical protein
MADAYTPSDGLKNVTSFVTDPADETAARKQVQDMLDQMLAFHNTHLADLDPHQPSQVKVYNNAAQSIPNITTSGLSFNSEYFDNDTIHDNTTNNSRLTCKTAGKYSICAQVVFDTNNTGYRQMYVKLNGTTIIAIDQENTPSTAPAILNCSTLHSLAVNNYIEVFVYQSSGGALNILANTYSPMFSMIRVG